MNMNKIVSSSIVLLILVVLGAGGIYVTNNQTESLIKENAFALEESNLKSVLPNASASDFTQLEVNGSDTIEKIFEVKGSGYVFKMNVKGFKNGSTFMVVLDDSAEIKAFHVISNGDTQGIGDKVMKDDFAKGLVGNKANEDKLDTISGATVSSAPIVEGIEEAATYMAENLK